VRGDVDDRRAPQLGGGEHLRELDARHAGELTSNTMQSNCGRLLSARKASAEE
jgi:hypothetical protein